MFTAPRKRSSADLFFLKLALAALFAWAAPAAAQNTERGPTPAPAPTPTPTVKEAQAVPKSVIGTDIEPNAAGALYKLVTYPRAGYWVAYSRTTGDEPLTVITMQKVATT